MSGWTGHEEWTQDAEAIAAQSAEPHSDDKPYGGTAAARRKVQCACGHGTNRHEGDEYGFCLVCDCSHYRPTIHTVGTPEDHR